MKSILRAVVLLPIAAIAILFAIANRHFVTVSFDPFGTGNPDAAVAAPLFFIVILAVMLGVLIGGTASWMAQGKHRKAARRARAEADRLKTRIDPPLTQP